MGKKAKTKTGKEKATSRKVDKSTLPPPPTPVDLEVSSVIRNHQLIFDSVLTGLLSFKAWICQTFRRSEDTWFMLQGFRS
jgi:hypothetical protein